MKNASVSKSPEAHKQTTKGSNLVRRRETKQQSPRNPLKDLNAFAILDSSHATACSSSSYSTALSTEAPRGCLRFLLFHHSTNCSRTPVIRQKSVAKSPKSAPIFRPAESRFRGENKWQSGRKPSSNAGFKLKIQPVLRSKKGDFSSESSSGSENLMQKKQENIALKVADDADEFSQLTLPSDDNGDGASDITPLTKLASGSGVASDSRGDGRLKLGQGKINISPKPPVEASVSPEIQFTDKRKCRPRGMLTVEDNYFLGFGKLKVCDNDDMKSINGVLDNPRDSVVASQWKLPCVGFLPLMRKLLGMTRTMLDMVRICVKHYWTSKFSTVGHLCPVMCSPQELSNSSKSGTTTSDATNNSRGVIFFFPPHATSGFQRFLGSSDCSENRASQISPVCMIDMNFWYDHDVETTTYSGDSSGSGNVIQTPQSDTSSDKCIGLTPLNESEIQKLRFKHELDSFESFAKAKFVARHTHVDCRSHRNGF
ncbi:hypothetical protein Ancab_008596 [Ancistrocladus abbreviatus]